MLPFGTILLLACGLSACLAHDFCSSSDAKIVVAQWQEVSCPDAAAQSKLTGGRAVFKKLFELAPGATALFGRVHVEDFEGPEFSAHIMRVMGGLDMLVNYLEDTQALEEMLAHLASQHVVREGVTAGAFNLMGNILYTGLPQIVQNFNVDAWRNCLTPILNGISAGLP